ncbi:TetR/AcrR family transcriptional regulator [Nocardioides limicola]|uniref:TetR/AcrR family transcriptional regulator n=1 Tax=Nocardioides limicola TaxID=2803368 RepID=UPI00193B8341|nr:TetR/AcrR family transcriptional regulator [Nocardioides sp. DJM-14]
MTQAPQRGRPRSAEASTAILRAVLDLIAENGSVGAVSVDEVASRSGVSKATIYRRWSSREEMIAAAVDSMKSPPVVDLPHESIRDDLIRVARGVRTAFSEPDRRVLTCIAFEAAGNDEFRAHHDLFLQRRRTALREVFEHWASAGVLRDGLDLDLASVMLMSPLLSVLVYGAHPELHTDELAEKVVDQLLSGLLAE